ncbi:hypothetical protein V1477_014834 [Vespula maculifrons]|uniref:Uncharacterized protein n=3 Tax=Vespula TaxID=7451 RepID=A0A834NQI0_VESPE|nr:hypothetical protein HZH66_010237 [Vespula vulgaris]KAF7415686.1 hypothetical protein H0235_012278 [Vespula pensylvanica]
MPRQRKALKAFARAKTTGVANRKTGNRGAWWHFEHPFHYFISWEPTLGELLARYTRELQQDDLTFCGRPKARRTLPLLVWDSENSESSTSNDVHVDQLP